MIKIGMMIGDRYEILEKIGTGGMSDVYKAKCHKLNRLVAVKVLKQEFSENANFVAKFRVEAQAAAGLMHPNIVNVYDVGEEDGIAPFGIKPGEAVGGKQGHQSLEDHDRHHQDHRIPELEEIIRTFQKHGFVLAEADQIGDDLQIHLIGHVGACGGDAVEDLAVVGGDLRLGHKGIGEGQNDGGQKQNGHGAQEYGSCPQKNDTRRAL